MPVPNVLNLSTSNPAEEWKLFRAAYENYEIASGLEEKVLKIRLANLLAIIGTEGFQLYNALPLTADDKSSIMKLLDALEEHISPQTNTIHQRFLFHIAKQEEFEPIDQYILRLRKLVSTCNYGGVASEMIRDKIVFGIRNDALRHKLLTRADLTLAIAISECQLAEATAQQVHDMKHEDTRNDVVNKVRGNQYSKCSHCGGSHERDRNKCPAFGKSCNVCKKSNHFAVVCRSVDSRSKKDKPNKQYKRKPRKIGSIDEVEYESGDSSDELNVIVTNEHNVNKLNKKLMYIDIKFIIDETTMKIIKCFCDTGSSCNVIGLSNLQKILGEDKPKLHKSNVTLKSFSGDVVNTIGSKSLICQTNGARRKLRFQVVDSKQMPLLSATTCQALGIIKMQPINAIESSKAECMQLLDEFADVFEGDGRLQGKVHLEIDETITPVQQHPRRVPVALRNELKELLADLEQRNIVQKVDEHTEWASNCLLLKRKGKMRLCIDPHELNQALKRCQYQIPTIEEVLPELSKAKVFSKLDAKNGFWQLELDDESSRLTTFWTPFGRYRWMVMPFGISSAPEIYQKRQHEVVEGLSGVQVMADDILV